MSEREIAEKMIKDGKKMVAEAEVKLAELDKPRMRHGDYGSSTTNEAWDYYVIIGDGKDATVHNQDGLALKAGTPLGCYSNKGESRLGNIFDDISRMKLSVSPIGRTVTVYDRYLFALPVKGCVTGVSDQDGAYRIQFFTGQPGGNNVTNHSGKYFMKEQCRIEVPQ